MNYRKYFSGTVDATTTTNRYYMGVDKVATGTTIASGHIKNRTDVIGNALVSTFQDIGYPNAYWDSTSGYFFVDKTNSNCGLYLSFTGSSFARDLGFDFGSTYLNRKTFTATTLSTSNNPFSNTGNSAASYAFYVTVVGEPKGTFAVFIGAYTSHAYTGGITFVLSMGTDKRDDSAVFCFNETLTNLEAMFVMKYSNARPISNATTASAFVAYSFLTHTTTLIVVDELIALVPIIFNVGFVILNNTYVKPDISNGWYEIDGDMYYVNNYYMTKCITEI